MISTGFLLDGINSVSGSVPRCANGHSVSHRAICFFRGLKVFKAGLAGRSAPAHGCAESAPQMRLRGSAMEKVPHPVKLTQAPSMPNETNDKTCRCLVHSTTSNYTKGVLCALLPRVVAPTDLAEDKNTQMKLLRH